MKLMLVEDDYLLNKAIKNYLKEYNVHSFLDGDEALKNIDKLYDVFIIDIDIPGINGIELLTEIKQKHKESYIIMISATIEIDTIEDAYNLGCDDYMKKPFDIKELKLKLDNIKNRFDEITLCNNLIYSKKSSKIIYKNDTHIDLTLNELKLLDLLIKNRGKLVNYETIEYTIWDFENESNQIRQLVNRLKKKIPIELIKNRRGQGYLIE